MWVLNQGHKGKLDLCSHKYKFIGLMDKTCTSWYYKPENGEVSKLHNVIFPCSCPINAYILVPSPPEGESGSIDDEQASQETGESPDNNQETHEIKEELLPKDWATDSIDSIEQSF